VVDPASRDELLRLETALASRDPGGIDGDLMSLVADDFVEFGRSGRTWTRESIRESLEGPKSQPVPIDRFEAVELAGGVVLVTYRTADAKRSSIWVRRDGRWQIRFHQGTPRER
jgi:hypothetical protein